jgi:hypothetical protein
MMALGYAALDAVPLEFVERTMSAAAPDFWTAG